MKRLKRFLTVTLATALSVTMTSAAFLWGGIGSTCIAYAASDTVAATGQCGDNLTYTVTGDNESGYAISITGTGDMNNYGLDEWAAPWRDYNFKSISIGDGVTSIGDYAFVLNGVEVKLTIGKKVKRIGEAAFMNTGIKGTLTIPNSVQTIGEAAFEETAITKLVLGKGIKELGDYAFCDIPSLKSVDASKSSKLTLIGDVCFNSDDQLKTMKINANKLKEVGNQSLSTYATTKVTVIAKTKSTYNKAVKLLKDGDRVGFSTLKFAYKKG